MPQIFISYRRDDAGYLARILADCIRSRFGVNSVFMDVDTIPLGVDFRKYINDAVAKCDVLLAIIGDNWLVKSAFSSQRRIDETDDFVRIELEAALTRNIPVIPVLAGKAKMPSLDDLPASLQSFAFRNATEIRSGRDMNYQINELIRGLRVHIAAGEKLSETAAESKPDGASSQEWTAAYKGNQIKVTNWWTWSGQSEARLYVNSVCVDKTTKKSLRGTIQDPGGSDHVVEVLFGGLITVKAKIIVDGVQIGGDKF